MKQVGALITSHHPDMPAFPALDGTLVPAGGSSRIHAEIRQRVRLPRPHGDCEPAEQYVGYEEMKMCVAKCMSDIIAKKCNCISVKVAVEIRHDQPNVDNSLPYCFDIKSYSRDELIAQASCVSNISSLNKFESCIDQCPQSCKEYQYLHDWSYSIWPSIWDLSQFYSSYISGKPYEHNYRMLKNSMTQTCLSAVDCHERKSQALKVIESNFLEVSYRLSNHRYMRLVDIPKSNIPDVCSKVGGVLNLWSGITAIVLLELFEMLCRMIKNWGELIRYGSDPGVVNNRAAIRDPHSLATAASNL